MWTVGCGDVGVRSRVRVRWIDERGEAGAGGGLVCKVQVRLEVDETGFWGWIGRCLFVL